jgi:hypothetical protein
MPDETLEHHARYMKLVTCKVPRHSFSATLTNIIAYRSFRESTGTSERSVQGGWQIVLLEFFVSVLHPQVIGSLATLCTKPLLKDRIPLDDLVIHAQAPEHP